jgi:hypothetical protein
MPAKWIEYKGRQVLYADYRKLSSKEFVALLEEADRLILASPNKVLYLGNIEDAAVSREVMDWLRRHGPDTAKKKVEKIAILGVTGVKKVLMDAVTGIFAKVAVPARPFKTEEEALEWLVK